MSKFTYVGRVWVFGDDINTDYIMPGFTPRGLSLQQRTRYCMRANRPGWSELVKHGDIIIGGRNFGCGSNRPAAIILKNLGLSCLVANSINSLMLRNCINFGFPALPCRGVTSVFKEGDMAKVDFEKGIINNTTNGKILETQPLPKELLKILEVDGLTPLLEMQGYVGKQ